jgi:hypothetical protein
MNRTATPTPAATTMHRAPLANAMHPGIVVCGPAAGITEDAHLMTGGPMHCVPVVGTSDDGPRHLDVRAGRRGGLAEHGVDHVLVTEPDQHTPLGILSALDVAQVLDATNPARPPSQDI